MKIRARLLKRFHEFKYRHAYADDFTDSYIATQIKVLREQQGLTQVQLAEKAGMKQSQISELEDVNHRGWKVRTLKRLAKAFDLFLVVRFEPFGKLLEDATHFDRTHLQRSRFADDPAFHGPTASTETTTRVIVEQPKGGVLLNASARFTAANEFDARVPNVA